MADQVGKFEQADGGMLFLDEVGDMSLEAQAKVLRALEQGIVNRVGGSEPIHVDVRVISATNKDLQEQIKEGGFREDLFYRLNVVPIRVPPLRERREDISMLIEHFSGVIASQEGMTPRRFDQGAVARLLELSWPGNVRELRNTIERLFILSAGEVVRSEDVNSLVSVEGSNIVAGAELLGAETFAAFKRSSERGYILQHLHENNWNVAETARRIEMPRSNLYKKIEKYGLVREE